MTIIDNYVILTQFGNCYNFELEPGIEMKIFVLPKYMMN